LARLADLLEDSRAFDPEFGYADFFHSGYILTMKKKVRKVTKERAQPEDSYETAMRSALARKPFLKTDGKYPTREEIYDRVPARG
jgi:hypothetical protein